MKTVSTMLSIISLGFCIIAVCATNASGSWVTSTIDSEEDMGKYSSIAIDSDNKVHISYCDSTNKDLKYAINSELTSPVLTVTISKITVTLSWTSVSNADGYTLFYAPPDISYIGDIDMGTETSFSLDLWEGAAFYVAVTAYNNSGSIEYSNIEYFDLSSEPDSTCGAYVALGVWKEFDCYNLAAIGKTRPPMMIPLLRPGG